MALPKRKYCVTSAAQKEAVRKRRRLRGKTPAHFTAYQHGADLPVVNGSNGGNCSYSPPTDAQRGPLVAWAALRDYVGDDGRLRAERGGHQRFAELKRVIDAAQPLCRDGGFLSRGCSSSCGVAAQAADAVYLLISVCARGLQTIRYLPEFVDGRQAIFSTGEAGIYRVDTNNLQKKGKPLGYRKSMDINDRAVGQHIACGSLVKGVLSDGWIRCWEGPVAIFAMSEAVPCLLALCVDESKATPQADFLSLMRHGCAGKSQVLNLHPEKLLDRLSSCEMQVKLFPADAMLYRKVYNLALHLLLACSSAPNTENTQMVAAVSLVRVLVEALQGKEAFRITESVARDDGIPKSLAKQSDDDAPGIFPGVILKSPRAGATCRRQTGGVLSSPPVPDSCKQADHTQGNDRSCKQDPICTDPPPEEEGESPVPPACQVSVQSTVLNSAIHVDRSANLNSDRFSRKEAQGCEASVHSDTKSCDASGVYVPRLDSKTLIEWRNSNKLASSPGMHAAAGKRKSSLRHLMHIQWRKDALAVAYGDLSAGRGNASDASVQELRPQKLVCRDVDGVRSVPRLAGFEYVSESIRSPSLDSQPRWTFSSSAKWRSPYSREGRLLELCGRFGGHASVKATAFFERGPQRVVRAGPCPGLQVQWIDDDTGWGLKTRVQLQPGQFVCEYAGQILCDSEAEERCASTAANYARDAYLFNLTSPADWRSLGASPVGRGPRPPKSDKSASFVIDAFAHGNVGRFLNHACGPSTIANISPAYVYVEDASGEFDPRFPKVAFFANRSVDPGEELRFDYDMSPGDVLGPEGGERCLPCRCGSEVCRGRVF